MEDNVINFDVPAYDLEVIKSVLDDNGGVEFIVEAESTSWNDAVECGDEAGEVSKYVFPDWCVAELDIYETEDRGDGITVIHGYLVPDLDD